MRRSLFLLAASALLATPFVVLAQGGPEKGDDIGVRLELNQHFYYAGDPFPVRISVGNLGEAKRDNPIKSPLFRSFDIKDAQGKRLEAKGQPSNDEPARPPKLSAGSFYGGVVDLSEVYTELKQPGTFQIKWAADGLSSQTIRVTILPRFDASKEHVATIKTTMGNIKIELAQDVAPVAAKAFVDMANAGFYNGLLFHEVRANRYVVAGDPQYAPEPRQAFAFPAEPTSRPLVAGTVVMKPVQPSPPSNGSQFIILLRPEPGLTGQVTVLGQVVEGLGVAQRISRVSSTQQTSRPHYKPLDDVRIVDVEIAARQPGGGAPTDAPASGATDSE